MASCFVMQPFDRDKFDRRFDDTFKPAIEAAGLEPYRVDRDPGVSIPIDEIERAISRADACFAEITTDNPNVWFELGFAIARVRPVCLVCSKERATPFPFDVRHRNIIEYDVRSLSDFKRLESQITDRLKAIIGRERALATIESMNPTAKTRGLSSHEVTALAIIGSNLAPEGLSEFEIRESMRKAGFTDIAAGLAIQSLRRKGFVAIGTSSDWNNNEYAVCRASDEGVDWLLENTESFNLLAPVDTEPPKTEKSDELPF